MDFKKYINYNLSEINCPQCKGDGGYVYCKCGGSGYSGVIPPTPPHDLSLEYADDEGLPKHLKIIEVYLNKLCSTPTQLTKNQLVQLDGMYCFLSTLHLLERATALKERVEKIKASNNRAIILNQINSKSEKLEKLSIFFDSFTDQYQFGITKIYGHQEWYTPENIHSNRLVLPTVKGHFIVFSPETLHNILENVKDRSILKGGPFDFYYGKGNIEDFIILRCNMWYILFDFIDAQHPHKSFKFLINTKTFLEIVHHKTKLVTNDLEKGHIYNSKDINAKKWL